MDKIKISICMPTHNRARFIEETLENVMGQVNDNIEIVIVDGASGDNTAEVVQRFQKRFTNIVYYRGKDNPGVDRDMARTIELARGEYCWMLSDDDFLKDGAVKRVLEEIKSGHEIYLCNVTACDLLMRPIRDRYWLSAKVKDRVFDLHDKNAFMEYCGKANSIGALFSYMSSIVLARRAWIKNGFNHDFDKSAYALAASLVALTKGQCTLKYIREPLVFWRNDNESFQNEGGLVKRFYLDFDGYLRIADKYLSDDRHVRGSFLRVMTREHPWYTIIHVTSLIDSPQQWEEFRAKMFKVGYGPRMAAICRALGRLKTLVSLGVMIKRRVIKSRWISNLFGGSLWIKRCRV